MGAAALERPQAPPSFACRLAGATLASFVETAASAWRATPCADPASSKASTLFSMPSAAASFADASCAAALKVLRKMPPPMSPSAPLSESADSVLRGLRKDTPAPMRAIVSAFVGWSPKMGTTQRGTPKERASCMLLAPPWVTKASQRGSRSTCGTDLQTTMLEGGSGKASRASAMLGPMETIANMPGSLATASKTARKTNKQNSLPV
mmetsp:Transcript_109433/g.288627  ORF Transcript_109433/g.288627 Transcript_109433/m.288627 type:complete len:208 (-) Transcript_109433:1025-1648(-)